MDLQAALAIVTEVMAIISSNSLLRTRSQHRTEFKEISFRDRVSPREEIPPFKSYEARIFSFPLFSPKQRALSPTNVSDVRCNNRHQGAWRRIQTNFPWQFRRGSKASKMLDRVGHSPLWSRLKMRACAIWPRRSRPFDSPRSRAHHPCDAPEYEFPS